MTKIEIGAIVTVILAIIAGALWLGNLEGKLESLNRDLIAAEKQKAIEEISKLTKEIKSRHSAKSDNLPVGTILASILPVKVFEKTVSGKWILADGADIADTKSDLVQYTKSLKVPDLRGMFLRGAGSGRQVGSFEGDATKLPNTPFSGVTTSGGEHTHPKGANHSSDKIKAGPYANMSTATNIPRSGAHSHSLVINKGGDQETRPKNIAVNFYIKIAN